MTDKGETNDYDAFFIEILSETECAHNFFLSFLVRSSEVGEILKWGMLPNFFKVESFNYKIWPCRLPSCIQHSGKNPCHQK